MTDLPARSPEATPGSAPTPNPQPRTPFSLRQPLWRLGFTAAVALQALLLALAWWPEPRVPVGDEKLYLAAARAPFEWISLPPLWPPLWPHVLRPMLAVGGGGLVVAIQVVLFVGVAAGIGILAGRAFGPNAVRPAVLLTLADPLLGGFAQFFWPETLHLALIVAIALLLTGPRFGLGHSLVVGLLAGLAVLIKTLFGPLLPLVALICAWRAAPGRPFWAAALATVMMAAVVLPWSLQAEQEVPGSGGASARFNLLVALREDGRQSLGERNVALETLAASRRAGRGWEARLDWIDQELAAELATTALLPEALDRLGRHPFRVFEWRSFVVEQLPGGDLAKAERGGFRATPRWAGTVVAGWSVGHTALLLILAAIGLAARPWRRPEVGVGLGIVGGWQVLVLLLVHAISRYRVQLEPVLLLLAVGGVVALLDRAVTLSWRRWSLAATLAAAFLGWAFAGGWIDRLGG